MICTKCGKTYSYASVDVKKGKIPHPELCIECGGLKVGEVKSVGKEETYFKSGIQGKKKKGKTFEEVVESNIEDQEIWK